MLCTVYSRFDTFEYSKTVTNVSGLRAIFEDIHNGKYVKILGSDKKHYYLHEVTETVNSVKYVENTIKGR
jgi:hypothetical protein